MRPLAALAVVLAGCTPMRWEKADLTPAQFQADEQECRQKALREAQVRSWQYQSALGPVFARDASGRGFYVLPGTAIDPYGRQMVEEQRLAQSCMEAKGYRLVPAPKQ
jgi:hypothetical protein